MPSYNKIMIMGHLGRDPELRYTQSGKAVANFTVAASDKYGGEEHTEWFRVVVWEKQAESCSQYLTKGSPVFVEGRVQTREWENKNGEMQRTMEVVAQRVQFLGSKKDRTEEPGASPAPEKPFPKPTADDDIPF